MIKTYEQTISDGWKIGWMTIDQARTLNALTLDMAIAMHEQLTRWVNNPSIVCIVLQGEGRAFCAGGDVRRMREGILAGDNYCERFFEQEYRLDYAIHTCRKPILAWGHGVVMGGGLGLLVGASHRVVTSSARLAMPETSIGLYPDVGASHFLNQLPEGLGLFLGISGCEWNAADAVGLGLADYALEDAGQEQLPALLGNLAWQGEPGEDHIALDKVLRTLAPAAIQPQLLPHTAMLAVTCRDIPLQALPIALENLPIDDAWYRKALETLNAGCPVTARLVEALLQRGKGMSLADCFRMEWIVSVQCCRHVDFPEGVRAQLVDKDKSPRWSFPSIDAVPAAYVEEHFSLPCPVNPLHDLGVVS